MVKIEKPADYSTVLVPAELLKNKRHLTPAEIEVLEKNLNHNDDPGIIFMLMIRKVDLTLH